MATAIQDSQISAPNVAPVARLQRDLRAALEGAIGGIVGTVPMSAAMLAARRMGLMGRMPPERITQKIFFRGRRRAKSNEARRRVATALHFAFGGVGGAMFAIIHRRLPVHVNPALHGVVFGALLWATSYMGWAPALGFMPQAHRDRPDRPIVMVVAHWIFGATLGAVVGWLGRAFPEPSLR